MTFEPFIRIKATATHIGVSVSEFRKLVAKRIIPCYRPTTRLLLFKLSEVDAALAKFRTGGVK